MTAAPWLGGGPASGVASWLTTADGRRIRARLWPLSGAWGTVLILPGRTEHAEKYGITAEWLADAGLASATLDWRGQGLSDRLARDPRKGHVGSFAEYQHDLAAFCAALTAHDLPRPWFLLAHSMGGTIGLRALLDQQAGLRVRAAAFSAPMWGIRVPANRPRIVEAIATLLVQLGLETTYAPPPATGKVCYQQSAPFAGNILTGDQPTWRHLQAELRAHPELAIAGPTIGWLAAALTECRALAALPPPDLPCLTGLGTQEQVVDPAAIRRRLDRWPGGQLQVIAGAQHELLMETPARRDEFRKAVLSLFSAQS